MHSTTHSVEWDGQDKCFIVRVPFADNWLAKDAPARVWDKRLKAWKLPYSRANVAHIRDNFLSDCISAQAKENLVEPEPPKKVPFPSWYPWPSNPPMPHQKEALDAAWEKEGFAWFQR